MTQLRSDQQSFFMVTHESFAALPSSMPNKAAKLLVYY
jgi:hypothetical protein